MSVPGAPSDSGLRGREVRCFPLAWKAQSPGARHTGRKETASHPW
jgi:hypothetical protein